MMIHQSTLALIACVLVGCAAPKAIVVEEPKKTPVQAENSKADPAPELPSDDGMRIGDMFVLPKEADYRATNPALPKEDPGTGTVIVNPPIAPNPKPKP